MTTEIVKKDTQVQLAMEFSNDQVQLIKNTVASGTTDDEFRMFLHFCKTSGLDPLRKQAYVIPRRYKDDDGNWKRTVTMMAGIDGFRSRAEQQPDFCGIRSAAIYEGEEVEIDYSEGKVKHKVDLSKRKSKKVVGAWAIVTRKDRIPYVQYIDWTEYYDEKSFMHRNKPGVMACKTAEATALRHEYPEPFSGIYTQEEMSSEYSNPVDVTDTTIVTNVVEEEKTKKLLDSEPQGPTKETVETVSKNENDKKLSQQFNIMFHDICKGLSVATGKEFNSNQKRAFLGMWLISQKVDIGSITDDDGIHVSRLGTEKITELMSKLKEPGMIPILKQYIPTDPSPVVTTPEAPKAEVKKDPPVTSSSMDDAKLELKKLCSEIETATNKDMVGMRLNVSIKKKHNLFGSSDKFTEENLRACIDEVKGVLERLIAGQTATDILKEY